MTYSAPLDHMKFVIDHMCEYHTIAGFPGFQDATPDTVEVVLAEAGKFARQCLVPINRIGDRKGCQWSEGRVTTSPEWRDTYTDLVLNGWNSPSAGVEFAGMGLPNVVNACIQEMFQGANMAFQLCPMLTQGAIEALENYSTDAQRKIFLPKMVTGEWSGTMNLTEPQAGSDLSAIRTMALPEGDHYRIKGQKIFITYGEHDLTENIIHLVLARLPDGPKGSKGLSLFIVPKILLKENGDLGEPNDVSCVSIEHKLGIHGSPTCTLAFGENDGALGYLIGEPNCGLEYMFAMMNNARLSVGLQGIGVSEHAYQGALFHAMERVQGGCTIVSHPDVSQTLGRMRTTIEAGRILAYRAAAALDFAKHSTEKEMRSYQTRRANLLIPIIKGFWCEQSVQIASSSIQIYGGMGFVEETGAAQHYRDARITTIYEGTTGIQALDLVGRKVLRDRGLAVFELIDEMKATENALRMSGNQQLVESSERFGELLAIVHDITKKCIEHPERAKERATTILSFFGYSCAVWCCLDAARTSVVVKPDNGLATSILTGAAIAVSELLPLAKASAETLTRAIDAN